jgi:hypothetical protein
MREHFWIIPATALLFSCNSENEPEYFNFESVEIESPMERFNASQKRIVEVIPVSGIRKDVNNIESYQIYQFVDLGLLERDTFAINLDYSSWHLSEQLQASDQFAQFRMKIAISDIDTSTFIYGWNEDLIQIQFTGVDTNQILWSKDSLVNNNWVQLWSVPSNEFYLRYLISTDLLLSSYTEYIAYDPLSDTVINYFPIRHDSLDRIAIAENVISAIKAITIE